MNANPMDALRCRVPEMSGDGLVIEQFTVVRGSLESMQIAMEGRACAPGTYTRLSMDGRLWMSDTDAERRDHVGAVLAAARHKGGRGLVNGLGLGLVVCAMLDHLAHVDVVEVDHRVCQHVGGWLREQYGERVTIHEADALTIKWPTGTRWNVAWHDIWPTIAESNLADMARLHRSYARRVDWQGSWAKHECRRNRERWTYL